MDRETVDTPALTSEDLDEFRAPGTRPNTENRSPILPPGQRLPANTAAKTVSTMSNNNKGTFAFPEDNLNTGIGLSRFGSNRNNEVSQADISLNNLLHRQMQLLELMATRNIAANPQVNLKLNELYLPEFDPDDNRLTVLEWCKQVDSLIDFRGCSAIMAMMKALSCVRGRAKLWADANSHQYATWSEVKNELITQFQGEHGFIHYVNKFRDYTSDHATTYAEYVTEAWRLFTRISPNVASELIVEAVISGIRPKYYQAELLRSAPKTQAQLIATLGNYRKRIYDPNYRKRNATFQSTEIDLNDGPSQKKQPRLEIVCNLCGKPGHRRRDCIKNRCDFCKRQGHLTEQCRNKPSTSSNNYPPNNARAPAGNNNVPTHQVNLTQTVSPCTTEIQIGKVTLRCLIDTGAECSLITTRAAGSIPGKRTVDVVQIKGITGQPLFSNELITTVATLDCVTFEISLHTVETLPYDVILGIDSLKMPGLNISITSSGISVKREYIAAAMEKTDNFDDIDTDLSDRSKLTPVLKKYKNIFGLSAETPKRVKTGSLSIRLKNTNKIVQRRPYRLSPVEREKVKELINDMKSKGIIRESSSPFASPMILCKKKNGDDRPCVDFRELNENTIRDHYPLPLIQDQIDKLGNAKYFTTLDMESGFHQIPIEPESIEKTAFVTPDGQYEYLTMPFGLCNAPSVFQRAINKALGDYKDTIALVYMDDVLIPSETIEEGVERLEKVFCRLSEAGFAIKLSKCKFLKKSIEYLGNVIENGQVKPSPLKVKALRNTDPPKNIKQLRQFNGLAGYFRRFIPNFSKLMAPLYQLTKKDSKFEWTHNHEKIRQDVIKYLTSEPVLSIFSPDLPTELHTDASSLGYGAMLLQIEENRRKVVSYFSMRTTDAESRYHSYELETLAVVKAIKHFRHFLFGRHFTVVSDCNALKASRNKKELTPRVHRWWAFLQSFDFDIKYRKGEEISHVDYLSRNPQVNIITKDPSWIVVEQERDSELKNIKEAILQKEPYDKKYSIKENLLLITTQDQNGKSTTHTVVPESLVPSLINRYHETLLHAGWERTLQKLKEQFWFKNMNKRVRSFCEKCLQCKVGKEASGKKQISLHPIDKVSIPFHTIHVDLLGNLTGCARKAYAFVAIDAFTKFVIIHSLRDKTTGLILKSLQEITNLFGTPSRIISDREPAIMGKEIQDYFINSNIEHHAIARGVPRANGQAERLMRTIRDHLVTIAQTQKRAWETKLGELQLAINCTKSKATGHSPLELLIGKVCSPPAIEQLSVLKKTVNRDDLRNAATVRLAEQASTSKERFDAKCAAIVPFEINDFVLCKDTQWSSNKLGPKYLGPYQITKILDHDRYEVKNIKQNNSRPIVVTHEHVRPIPTPNLIMNLDSDSDPRSEDTSWTMLSWGDEISKNNIENHTSKTALDRRKKVRRSLSDSRVVITQHFTERTVTSGGDISMQCAATGDRPPQFVWERDGIIISSNTDPRYALGQLMTSDNSVVTQLNITRVRVEDGGLYSCTAREGEHLASHENRLDVYGPPYIRAIPPIKVQSGESVNLRCPFYGYPINKIDWEYKGKTLSSNILFQSRYKRSYHRRKARRNAPIVNMNGVLSISEVSKEFNGEVFTCVVTSPSGEMARRAFEMQVIEAPVLEDLLLGNNLQEGQIVNIYCNVKSGDLPIHFEWLKDGKRIPSNLKVAERSSELFSALVIKKVALEHCGTYTCVASNHVAKVNKSTELYIKVAPKWQEEPSNSSLLLGRRGTVSCSATGYPQPQVHWMKKDAILGTWQPVLELAGGGILSLPNGTLVIEEVSLTDEGLYSCNVENGVGQPLSKTVWMSVNKPVHFESSSVNVTSRLGHPSSLACKPLGDEPIRVTWMHQGSSVDFQNPRIKLSESKTSVGVVSTISFQYSETADGGIYQCRATNPYGSAVFSVHLTILEPPTPPSDVRIDAVNSRTAAISWRDLVRAHARYYTVQYAATHYTLIAEVWTHASSLNVTRKDSEVRQSIQLQNLRPATAYAVRVATGNQVGVSVYTTAVHFTTQEEAPSSPPTSVQVEQTENPGELLVSWLPALKDTHNGLIMGYHVKATPQGRHTDGVDTRTLKVSQKSGKQETLLSDLLKNTRYSVSVAAFTNAGTGPFSLPVYQDTREGAPEQAPSSVECTAVSAISLRVGWQPIAQAGQGSSLVGYNLLYANEDGAWQNHTSIHTEVYLQGLQKYANYTVKVAGFSNYGAGPYSYPIVCATLQDMPGPPADIKVLVLSASSLLISWKRPEHPNGELLYYTVYVKPSSSNGSPQTYRVEASRTTTEVKDLTTGRTYEAWVTASTRAGEGSATRRVSHTPSQRVVAGVASLGGTVSVGVGSSLLLVCQCVGVPPPRTVWYHKHNIITHHPRYTRNHDDSLLINNIDQSLSGNYTCLAKNLYGSDSVEYVVNVLPLPDAPILRATPYKDSILVEWEQPYYASNRSLSQKISYSLTWKEADGPWQEAWPTSKIPSLSVQKHALSGLKCGTKYSLRITATNKVGTSQPAYLDVSTLGGVPIPPPSSEWLWSNCSHLFVQLAGWDDAGCELRAWDVDYRPLGGRQWIRAHNNIAYSDIPSWGLPEYQSKYRPTSFAIADLSPGTWYQIRVTASNEAGSVTTTYNFATKNQDGSEVGPPSESLDLNTLVILCSSILLAVCVLCSIYIIVKRQSTETEYHDSIAVDNKSESGNLTSNTSHTNIPNIKENSVNVQNRIYSAPVHHLRNNSKHELYEISPYAQFAVGFRTFGHVENQDLPSRLKSRYDTETSFQVCSESEDSDSISKSTLKSVPRKSCRTPHHR